MGNILMLDRWTLMLWSLMRFATWCFHLSCRQIENLFKWLFVSRRSLKVVIESSRPFSSCSDRNMLTSYSRVSMIYGCSKYVLAISFIFLYKRRSHASKACSLRCTAKKCAGFSLGAFEGVYDDASLSSCMEAISEPPLVEGGLLELFDS